MTKIESWSSEADYMAMYQSFIVEKGWIETSKKVSPKGRYHFVFKEPESKQTAGRPLESGED